MLLFQFARFTLDIALQVLTLHSLRFWSISLSILLRILIDYERIQRRDYRGSSFLQHCRHSSDIHAFYNLCFRFFFLLLLLFLHLMFRAASSSLLLSFIHIFSFYRFRDILWINALLYDCVASSSRHIYQLRRFLQAFRYFERWNAISICLIILLGHAEPITRKQRQLAARSRRSAKAMAEATPRQSRHVALLSSRHHFHADIEISRWVAAWEPPKWGRGLWCHRQLFEASWCRHRRGFSSARI